MKFFKNTFVLILFVILSSVFAFAQNTGGLKGKVRTPKGSGIASVSVLAKQNGREVKTTTSNAKGEFVLDGLEAGNYNIIFDKDGYSSGALYDVEVKKNKVRDLGGRLVLAIDQGTQVIIKGSVFDQDGRSVYGAKVEIERISSDGKTRKIGSGYTSQSGEFTFRSEEKAAKFRITALSKGISASKEIEVSGAAVYRLAITLKAVKSDEK